MCIMCGKKYHSRDTIKHRNKEMSEEFAFCRDCVLKKVEEDKHPRDTLRFLNIPYQEAFWKVQVDKFDTYSDAFIAYIKVIAPQIKKYPDFHSSTPPENFEEYEPERIVVTDDIIGRWGAGKSNNDYYELELGLKALKAIKNPETILAEKDYVDLISIEKRYREAITSANANELKHLRSIINDYYERLELNVGLKDMNDFEVLGQRIRNWEKKAPIPNPDKELFDVDKVKQYIRDFFYIPVARNFGKATKEEMEILHSYDVVVDKNDE